MMMQAIGGQGEILGRAWWENGRGFRLLEVARRDLEKIEYFRPLGSNLTSYEVVVLEKGPPECREAWQEINKRLAHSEGWHNLYLQPEGVGPQADCPLCK